VQSYKAAAPLERTCQTVHIVADHQRFLNSQSPGQDCNHAGLSSNSCKACLKIADLVSGCTF